MFDEKSLIEKTVRKVRNLADKVKSDERDTDTIDWYVKWRQLHIEAIELLNDAENYKCPIRTQAVMNISHALDDNALPVDFYKRLVSVYNEVRKVGNRRTKNQMRDVYIRRLFEVTRAGFWIYKHDFDGPAEDQFERVLLSPISREGGRNHQMKAVPGDHKDTFVHFNYENTLKVMAKVLNLKEKTIENIVLKKVGVIDPFEPMVKDEDFARFRAECKKRETEIWPDPDENKTP